MCMVYVSLVQRKTRAIHRANRWWRAGEVYAVLLVISRLLGQHSVI
jgi:hypothetical protein